VEAIAGRAKEEEGDHGQAAPKASKVILFKGTETFSLEYV
jgi:hypothetical protein